MSKFTQSSEDDDISIAEQIRKMSRVMAFCSDDVRHDLQRNLLQAVESLMRSNPVSLNLFASFREMAETVVGKYEDRGKLHIGLRQIFDKENHSNAVAKHSNVWIFQSLKMRFNSHNPAEKFMIDRLLAKRTEEGKLNLTAWGKFVLDYMNKKERENFSPQQDSIHIVPAIN